MRISTVKVLHLISIPCFFVLSSVWSRDVAPIVAADWLEQNLTNSKVVVLDIRAVGQYRKGHIPGSISIPLSFWTITNDGLSLELPSDEALQALLGKSGINPNSTIVVVGGTETNFSRADVTRVAWTCMVAGVKNVAVLNGGYNQWLRENKPTSTDTIINKSKAYAGTIDRSTLTSKSHVLSMIGKSILVDARIPEDYFGITSKPGHIKSAVNVPVPWLFASDGTFLKEEDLQAIASGVLGTDRSEEIIVYCGVGGYASTLWFVLTQMLGYRNVKLYDGSMEEWIRDPSNPVSRYTWH
jgi:thiosulfate/3-mercaptopyruvate sulfurtransferase